MKRIVISDTHERWASEYLVKMLYKKFNVDKKSAACRMLNELSNAVSQGWYVPIESKDGTYSARQFADITEYIEMIVDRYEALLTFHPKDFVTFMMDFNDKIPTDEVAVLCLEIRNNLKGVPNNLPYKKTLLHEEIVRCMRYNYVQREVFPYFIRMMGIKTCVYCNAQYAVTTTKKNTSYQLDHCLPKSLYPYLCTNFFNLQPCCGSCNQGKSANDMIHGKYTATIWKEKDDKSADYFNFSIGDSDMARYQIYRDSNKLSLKFNVREGAHRDLRLLYNDFNNFFHIQGIYNEHRDVAEEIIWKKYAYSPGYMSNLESAFEPIAKKMNSDFPRFIMGNYMEENQIYKRPLAKMVQDIAKQLHIDFGLDEEK
jgi:hypothetical protein